MKKISTQKIYEIILKYGTTVTAEGMEWKRQNTYTSERKQGTISKL